MTTTLQRDDIRANPLAECHSMADLSSYLADNVRLLRGARGMTQLQMAKLAGLPRATWANLETGSANPTLAVLHAVALALGVSIEELLARPRAAAEHHVVDSLAVKRRGGVLIRRLLPHPLPGVELDRLELPVGARMSGVPHTPGTREYLTCEKGRIELVASGERYVLEAGDVVAFAGDQKHSYANAGESIAIGFSVVMWVPPMA